MTVIIICVILHAEQRKRNRKTGNGRKDERKRLSGKEVPRLCSGRKITGFSARRICREPEKREQAEIEKER